MYGWTGSTTPEGLFGVWGDGRLFVLGTDGYIEVRKYTDVAVGTRGNNLFIVRTLLHDWRYIVCINVTVCLSGRTTSASIAGSTALYTAHVAGTMPAAGG